MAAVILGASVVTVLLVAGVWRGVRASSGSADTDRVLATEPVPA